MLVIFDCDGVLVDSEIIAAKVFAEHLQSLDVKTSPEECFRRFKGYSMKTCMAELVEMLGGPIPPEFLRAMQKDTMARFERELEPVAGVVDALAEVERLGLATCVASSGDHSKMRVTLNKTGLWQRFEGRIYSAVDVQAGKPAPDVFLHAAASEGYSPEQCAVIEDSMPGVQAALAAKMPVFYYDPAGQGLGDPALAGHPQVTVFANMAELPPLLQSRLG
ncbi:MAG: HAD family hydrolase [Cellvibrionaceae bacterium]|nr:HAD family hydrolase [Cellvibrionaceae bacterium]